MHHQYRFSVLQWKTGPARRTSTKIFAATCGRFHAVILQKASDHVPHVSHQFIAYTCDTDLAIFLNRDTSEANAAVFAFHEASTSKGAWGTVVLVVRGLLRRPSLSGTPTVTFALFTFTVLGPRNATPPPICSDDCTHTWLRTTSTSSVATST